MEVSDIKSAWDRKYKEYMDVDVPSAADGVLQDVHWSHASFGYFPTYTLGSLYAAQFFATALEQIDGLETQVRTGEYDSLLQWLRDNIHQHGRMYDPEDLCVRVTGRPLDVSSYLNYARRKFGEIYELEGVAISSQ